VDDDARRAAARADMSAAAALDTARSPGDEHAGASEETRAVTEPIEAARCTGPVGLVPGTTLAGGRYRLLVFHGGPDGLQCWQALDTVLPRQVAITIVGLDGSLPDGAVDQILTSTLRLRRVDHPGIARLLDVARTERGGLVVAEWLRGGSLVEVADTAPSPLGAARALGSLVAAAEAAHRSGQVLSIDHPSRVRVSMLRQQATHQDTTTRTVNPLSESSYIQSIKIRNRPESAGPAPSRCDAKVVVAQERLSICGKRHNLLFRNPLVTGSRPVAQAVCSRSRRLRVCGAAISRELERRSTATLPSALAGPCRWSR
jgi:hypothetical protein